MSNVRWLLVVFFYSILAFFLQGTFLRIFLPPYLIPHFCVLLVVFMAFYEVSARGAFLTFLCGVLVDVSAGGIIGPSAAALLIVYGVLAVISDRIFVESGLASFMVTLASVVIYQLTYLALMTSINPSLYDTLVVAIGQGLITGFITPWFFYFFLRKLKLASRRRDLI